MIRNGITGHNVNQKTENSDETGKPKSIRAVQDLFLKSNRLLYARKIF